MTMTTSLLVQKVNLDEMQRLLDAYSLTHGVHVAAFDEEGEILFTSFHPPTRVCSLIQQTKYGQELCQSCLSDIGKQAIILGEGYVHRCPAGLIVWVSPLVSSDQYLGGLVAGQVLMWEMDDISRRELARLASACGIAPQSLINAASRLPAMDPQQVQAASDLLFAVAAYLSIQEEMPLIHHRRVSYQQARLAESIIEKKKSPAQEVTGPSGSLYPLDKERQLLGRVRLGDRSGAKEILNQLLGDILFNSAGRPEVLKARLLELSVVLSRAAVEGGGSLHRLLGLNFAYVQELAGIEPIEEICAWIVKVLDTFVDEVYATRETRTLPVIRQAVRYIKEHFREELTLDDVAQAVHFSPYYVSRLFKEELGMNFIEYLTRIRIDEAKRMLLETNQTVSEIAVYVGYQDPSYFTKVFKKMEGRTPTQFRR
jgi:two-component system response regulator YesN